MNYVIFTDYKKEVLAVDLESGNMGLATLGKKEQFSLLHGAKVAAIRAFVAPGVTDAELLPVGILEVSNDQLIMAVRYVGFDMGYMTYQNPCEPGLWRSLDNAAHLLSCKLTLIDFNSMDK